MTGRWSPGFSRQIRAVLPPKRPPEGGTPAPPSPPGPQIGSIVALLWLDGAATCDRVKGRISRPGVAPTGKEGNVGRMRSRGRRRGSTRSRESDIRRCRSRLDARPCDARIGSRVKGFGHPQQGPRDDAQLTGRNACTGRHQRPITRLVPEARGCFALFAGPWPSLHEASSSSGCVPVLRFLPDFVPTRTKRETHRWLPEDASFSTT